MIRSTPRQHDEETGFAILSRPAVFVIVSIVHIMVFVLRHLRFLVLARLFESTFRVAYALTPVPLSLTIVTVCPCNYRCVDSVVLFRNTPATAVPSYISKTGIDDSLLRGCVNGKSSTRALFFDSSCGPIAIRAFSASNVYFFFSSYFYSSS